MRESNCTEPSCDRPTRVRGLCSGCYQKARRDGTIASHQIMRDHISRNLNNGLPRLADWPACDQLVHPLGDPGPPVDKGS